MKNEDIKPNDHVWALLKGELVVAIKKSKITTHAKDDEFFVCGGWEGPFNFNDFDKIISIIEKPIDFINTNLYF